MRRISALVSSGLAVLLVVTLAVVLPQGPQAQAASHTFLVNSLSPTGDDLNPGDGVCLTAAGTCTLRAALQESNALPVGAEVVISPAPDVDSATPGVQSTGTIRASGLLNSANFMYVGALTPQDGGAYFMATRPVTLDFQNRLGIESVNDTPGATAIYVNGPDVKIRNFSNIRSNETAFVVSGQGDRALIENGSVSDVGTIVSERAIWLQDGANDVIVRRVLFDSLYDAGIGAIVVGASATINNLWLDRIVMRSSDAEAYDGITTNAAGAATAPTLNGMKITGSTFTLFNNGSAPFAFAHMKFSGAQIHDNLIAQNNSGLTPIMNITQPSAGAPNVVSHNTFDSSTKYANYAINMNLAIPSTQQSGWVFEDNFFDGFKTHWANLINSGIVTVKRNAWGTQSANAGSNLDGIGANLAGDEEARHWASMYLGNWDSLNPTNSRVRSWYPTSVTRDDANCTATVQVNAPTDTAWFSTAPTSPVDIDVYFTATSDNTSAYAEVYLGSQTGVTGTVSDITVPYTLGAGFLRVQTTDSLGRSTQFSRVVPTTGPDLCAPKVTVEQARVQEDPAVNRDLLFTVTTSEPVAASGAESLQLEDFDVSASTAPGTRVTQVRQDSPTSYTVTARADGSGDVILALPAGTTADLAGNPSRASTSVDNRVTYVSPLSLDPESVTVTEGAGSVSYTVNNSLTPTAPVYVAPTVADPLLATVSPTELQLATIDTSGDISVSAIDDSIVNGERATTIAHVVTSTDAEFDGLKLPDVEVVVFDDDTPDPATSTVAASAGTVAVGGTESHTVTATVRNSDGRGIAGVTVTFDPATELTASASTCTSGADGTCSITVTSSTIGSFTVGAAIAATELSNSPATVQFGPGAASLTKSTIESDPATITANGTDTAQVTVKLNDSFGNSLVKSGGIVSIITDAGTITATKDNGDGTYSATLTAPTVVGTATLSFTIDSAPATNQATVELVAGPADLQMSQMASSPATIVADGATTSTITLTLFDAFGNRVTESAGSVQMQTTAGTLSPEIIDNADGTYTAVLTSPTSTTIPVALVSYTLNNEDGLAVADVAFVPGEASPTRSTISASPTEIVADGSTTSTITVTLRDGNDNLITVPGNVVAMTSSLGTIDPDSIVEGPAGTFTATLTSPTTAGTGMISFTVNDVGAAASEQVRFVPGPMSGSESTIAASPTLIPGDGASQSLITVTAFDAYGNRVTNGGAEVVITTDLGDISATTDHGDGLYTAELTAPAGVGTANLGFTLSGNAAGPEATVKFKAGAPDASKSEIRVNPASIVADGTSTATVTVTLRDSVGNLVSDAGDVVSLQTTLGTVSAMVQQADGTYTGLLTSGKVTGQAEVSFFIDAVRGVNSAKVDFVAGQPDAGRSTITRSPSVITADGVATSLVTVTLRDTFDHLVTDPAYVVTMSQTIGSLSEVAPMGDGTFTAVLTSSTTAGVSTVTFAIDGTPSENNTTVEFSAGEADANRSTIVANPVTITADGIATSEITVTLYDANSNLVTAAGDVVDVQSDKGTVGNVINNLDGTYSATLTSDTVAGPATVSFAVGEQPSSHEAVVTFAPGAADANKSTIAVTPNTLIAGSASPALVTVQLKDQFGNNITTSGDNVEFTASAGTLSGVTYIGNGQYTAEITAPTATGEVTLGFSVNSGEPSPNTATVSILPDVPDLARSEIIANPASLEANGSSQSSILVTLKDQFGNLIGASAGAVTFTTTAGTLPSLAADNGDGTYTGTLTAPATTDVPQAVIGFALESQGSPNHVTVDFVPGSPSLTNSTISAADKRIVADGTSTTQVTVTLKDGYGSLIKDAGDIIAMSTSAGSFTSVTDQGDGTYTATLTSATVAQDALLNFTISDTQSANSESVEFIPGPIDTTRSTLTASPTSITADGSSTSAVTLTAFDSFGNRITSGGEDVAISTNAGTISATSDLKNGLYSAVLTSSNVVETADLSAKLGASDFGATATVNFVQGPADPGKSAIVATPVTIESDGVDSSVVRVTLKDAHGNTLSRGGDTVSVLTSLGTLSDVTDHDDGTYTVTLTGQKPGKATIRFAVNGTPSSVTASVSIVDSVAPDAPVITSPRDGEARKPGVAISGTGEPGAALSVFTADGQTICSTTVSANGAWNCNPDTPFVDGPVTIVAKQADPSGNISPESAKVRLTIMSQRPAAPVLDPTNGAKITGRSVVGTTVTIRDSGGNTVCESKVKSDGTFTCVPATPMPQGMMISATSRDAAGNESSTSFVRVGGAAVRLDSDALSPGARQIARGTGFMPGEKVVGVLTSTPVQLGTQTADEQGSVTFVFNVPSDIELGTHRVTLTGPESGAVFGEFEVTKPAAEAPNLVNTGSFGQPGLIIFALGVLALGAGFVLARGKRRLR